MCFMACWTLLFFFFFCFTLVTGPKRSLSLQINHFTEMMRWMSNFSSVNFIRAEMGAELPVVDLGTDRTVFAVSLGVSFRFSTPKPEPLNLKSSTRNPKSDTRNLGTGRTVLAVSLGISYRFPESEVLNPKPETRNPKFETRNPRVQTQKLKPEMRKQERENAQQGARIVLLEERLALPEPVVVLMTWRVEDW